MPALYPVIVPGKVLKDGRHKIRIYLSHNCDCRYILTDIILNSEKEFKNGQIVRRHDSALLNAKLRGILQKYQTAIDDLEYIEGLTCAELLALLKQNERERHRTFGSVCAEYMENSQTTPQTIRIYKIGINSFSPVIGENVRLDHINHLKVRALDRHYREHGISSTTIRGRMALLRSILLYAQRSGYVQYRVDPFVHYTYPPAEVRQAWLSVEQIRAIRDYTPEHESDSFCKDMFMLSYYLGGINMVDMLKIDFAACRGKICYERTKTEKRSKLNKYVEFDIPPEAFEIIDRRIGEDGRIAVTDSGRRLSCASTLRIGMKRMGLNLGIHNLIFYSARKSFSQHAFTLGVPTQVIDYLLGHTIGKGSSCLYHYITVTPEQATAAVKKVLENLRDSK